MNPVLLVIAGPNGSGKTTVTEQLKRDHWSDGVTYLNPDDIARDRFGDWNSREAVLAAARWTDGERERLVAAREDLAFETVFSTDSKVEFLGRARGTGYFTRLFFIGTSSPEINAKRVMARVLAGGHTVPLEKIADRYVRSMANLSAAIRVADRVYVYDNSADGVDASLCARTVDGQLRKVHRRLPEWVEDALVGVPRHPEFVDARDVSRAR